MDAVPQQVLNWLHSVLLNGYRDVNRAYHDVGYTLSRYQTIRPSTDVYTFDDGHSALLLRLTGTVPASFRGATYSFPVSIWIPQEYPAWPPITFVTVAQGMAIRPGQHVSVEGKIYHPYLGNWHPDRSNILGLLQILTDIFSREPPLVARQAGGPPLPPGPNDQQASTSLRSGPSTSSPAQVRPPALPPKGGQQQPAESMRGSPRTGQGPPPRPPKDGGQGAVSYSALGQSREQSVTSPPPPQQPTRKASISLGRSPASGEWQQPQHYPPSQQQQQQWQSGPYQQSSQPPQPPQPQYQQQHRPQPPIPQYVQQPQSPRGPLGSAMPHATPSWPMRPTHPTGPPLPQQAPVGMPAPRKIEPQDLLTSPFDVPLPESSNLPVPPVPPNPEKDALLQAITASLQSQLQSNVQSITTALPSLQAQQSALAQAQSMLQQEFAHLRALEAQVRANEATLHASLKEADSCIADAKQRPVPNIDETLIAPTVLSNQIYTLVAEEKSCLASREVLLKALDRGRLGVDQWSRHSRSIAREEWHKKWLIRRAARGMGLQGVESAAFAGEKEVVTDENSFYR